MTLRPEAEGDIAAASRVPDSGTRSIHLSTNELGNKLLHIQKRRLNYTPCCAAHRSVLETSLAQPSNYERHRKLDGGPGTMGEGHGI